MPYKRVGGCVCVFYSSGIPPPTFQPSTSSHPPWFEPTTRKEEIVEQEERIARQHMIRRGKSKQENPFLGTEDIYIQSVPTRRIGREEDASGGDNLSSGTMSPL